MSIFFNVILSILCIVVCISYFRLSSKQKKLITLINTPLRKGYIEIELTGNSRIDDSELAFTSLIYVIETERFKSGESKIKIDYIETCISESKIHRSSIESFIIETFKSTRLTTDIHWLETDISIKEMRKDKLKYILGKK